MSTLQRETAPKDGFLPSLLPQHENAAGDYVATGENNPLPVLIQLIKGMMPIQFQETLRTQTPIATHASVVIGAGATNTGAFIDARGYDKCGINVYMISGVNMAVKIETSFDGTAYFSEKTLYQGTSSVYVDVIDIPAPYFRLTVKNTDTATKTANASILLKS